MEAALNGAAQFCAALNCTTWSERERPSSAATMGPGALQLGLLLPAMRFTTAHIGLPQPHDYVFE